MLHLKGWQNVTSRRKISVRGDAIDSVAEPRTIRSVPRPPSVRLPLDSGRKCCNSRIGRWAALVRRGTSTTGSASQSNRRWARRRTSRCRRHAAVTATGRTRRSLKACALGASFASADRRAQAGAERVTIHGVILAGLSPVLGLLQGPREMAKLHARELQPRGDLPFAWCEVRRSDRRGPWSAGL
jgi:hypothetical protein